MTSIICNKLMSLSNRIVLLYLSDIKQYEGTTIALADQIGISKQTLYKSLRYLHTEGFIHHQTHCNGDQSFSGVKIRYLDS